MRQSITKLQTKARDLELSEAPLKRERAQQAITKLDTLDREFRSLHFQLIDLLDDQEDLQVQQETLDHADEDIADLRVRLSEITKSATPTTPTTDDRERRTLVRRLAHLDKTLHSVDERVTAITGEPDKHLLKQYKEQLNDIKSNLHDAHNELLELDLEEDNDLYTKHAGLESLLFDCSLKVSKLSSGPVMAVTRDTDHTGVKLPRLEVPSFDGNILNWIKFWEQFSVSVHDRSNLSDSERLVYLQHALRDGSAKAVIEGLSQSGENYTEAIGCLRLRYDRPRLIHQTHVKMIVDAPPLREGTGRELRKLHDVVQQHLRALKSMDHDPSGPFITSVLELKLDTTTMFEWQRHSQDQTNMPHYQDLLDFINLRAQASETLQNQGRRPPKSDNLVFKRPANSPKQVTSFATQLESSTNCIICKGEKHPLYVCPSFKTMSHDSKIAVLKEKKSCMNCLNGGHFVKNCKSIHRCKKCQKPHHTLLHFDEQRATESPGTNRGTMATSYTSATNDSSIDPRINDSNTAVSHTAIPLKSSTLLMTCRVLVTAPNGTSVEARALLDNASSASFVSERLAQNLRLPRSNQNITVSGIAGLQHKTPIQSVTRFEVSPVALSGKNIGVTAIIVPRVTCDLPLSPVPHCLSWRHLSNLPLADPSFGEPGKIDVLLGIDVFSEVLLHGQRSGSPGTPTAFETVFGWVLGGKTDCNQFATQVATLHVMAESGNDILHKFWELEEQPKENPLLSREEREVVKHFQTHHYRKEDGRFVVPLPKNPTCKPIGESRSQAVRRFLSLEKSLRYKGQFEAFERVMLEYVELGHAEFVPANDLEKPQHQVFYLPMHAVYKDSSSTTKIRAVFDASAKSSTGVSLNDTLMVGPTIHPPLIDVLLKFRFHRIALTSDVSKMYRAIELTDKDRDFHRFVWRSSQNDVLRDYRMTRVTFGVSASSFAANMSVKQNALDHAHEYPLAIKALEESFYVDDALTGADSREEAIQLQRQLQALFTRGGFLLRKWNSNDCLVLDQVPPELRDNRELHSISDASAQTKTLGFEWNTQSDQFHLTIADLPSLDCVTKRALVSDIAKTFDALGWFAPTLIQAKILLQRLWERKVEWDQIVPDEIKDAWLQWRQELPLLSNKQIDRCYYPKDARIKCVQIHGFCDASENAYVGVVYLRMIDSNSNTHVSLVMAKTKVAPIKRLTIPRLELCGAYLLSRLLRHVKDVFQISMDNVFAWTDSTIVLCWLNGNPRRLKTFVGNRISFIMDQISPDRWNHVNGSDNPADCASRGLPPSQLLEFDLWWRGPSWLLLHISQWPKQSGLQVEKIPEEEREISLILTVESRCPLFPFDKYSTFTRFKRVTAWILRFLNNCRKLNTDQGTIVTNLLIPELVRAENYWIVLSQYVSFPEEIQSLKVNSDIPSNSSLVPLSPFLDEWGVLRVGGRIGNSRISYVNLHPIVLHGKHTLTRLIIRTEHLRLLHAGPTLLTAELCRRFHIISCRKTIRSVLRQCVPCLKNSIKPQPQKLGQLPMERITPDSIFKNVGVDYAGPLYVKYGSVRKPTVLKAYVCVFVSLSVKAVHLELVSDLTAESFISALRRFIARRGHPAMIWSDHGTNFVGANRELKELSDFLDQQRVQDLVSGFCSSKRIAWKFIPEHSPHFGGLWEAAVKSFKTHLKRVTTNIKLTFEEMTTVLSQIEACLNSRPLTPLSSNVDGVEVLTPGHFLIGRPLMALPDPAFSYRPISILKRWHLCQQLVRHFWQRWSCEYLTTLNKYNKWFHPKRNVSVGDVVIVREDNLVPCKWSLARVAQVYTGKDGLVRVVTVKTAQGIYKRPVTKIAVLLPIE